MKKLLLFLLLMGQLTAAQFDIRIPQIVSGTDFTNVVVNPPALSLLGFDVSQAPTTYTPGAGVLTFIQTPTLANLNIALGVTLTASTTVGGNLVGLTNPGAITFLRINADNTVDTLSAANFLTAIGAGPAYTGTAGQVTVTGSVLSLPTAVTGVNSITSATGQALTLATLDGNKDIVLAPHGSGRLVTPAVKFNSGLDYLFSDPGDGSIKVTDYQGTVLWAFYTGNTGRGGIYAVQLLPLVSNPSDFSDNAGTIGKSAQRWSQIFLGPTGVKIGDGTSGPTITATGSSPNEAGNLSTVGTAGWNINGTRTNDSAAFGDVGEIVSGLLAVGSANGLAATVAENLITIALSTGDWDVSGHANFTEVAATVVLTVGGITTTSATIPTDGSEVHSGAQGVAVTCIDSVSMGAKRISITATAHTGITAVAATDIVTDTAHGYSNGQPVYFTAIAGGAGLVISTMYYVRDSTTDTYKLAATSGGAAINITTDITSGTVKAGTLVYLVGSCTFTGTSVSGFGAINARRRR